MPARTDDRITRVAIETLIPYARNARTHSDAQVAQIAASIREFGWTNPVLIDKDGGIIAGHGRVMAARKLGLESVPCLVLEGLTEVQKRAYILADNQLALNAGWDEELLRLEFEDLKESGFDLFVTGFSDQDLAGLMSDAENAQRLEEGVEQYTRKIDAPVYKPTLPEPPPLDKLCSLQRYEKLLQSIDTSNLQDKEKQFLRLAATRHIRFDFEQVAEYYAHASPECQRMMEDSALVIIDFDRAIQLGYVKLTQRISELYSRDTKDGGSA